MKDLKISKELIKNVLVKETENLSDEFTFSIKDNYILFADEGECQFEVNIYEFAFKCKEWALINGYLVMSGNCETFKETNKYYDSHDNISILYTYASVRKIGTLRNEIELRGDSEAELIIKACNWILEMSNEKI